jgi:hypothetical protein
MLIAFLHGDVSFAQLEVHLRPTVSFSFRNEAREVRVASEMGIRVPVTPEDLRPMLEKFMAGEVEAEEVSVWASVIMLVPAYEHPGTGRSAEFLWDRLIELSGPPYETNVGHPEIEWIVAARDGLWKSGKGARPSTAFPTFPQALPPREMAG